MCVFLHFKITDKLGVVFKCASRIFPSVAGLKESVQTELHFSRYVTGSVSVCLCCFYIDIFVNCYWVDARWQWKHPVAVDSI